MFSNTSNPRRLIGSILLVSGCCIGAGMLGLPVITAMAGYVPSLLLLFVAWAFMTTTGLLLLEVGLYFSDSVGLISMASRTLGKTGKAVCWITFLFLFYCLMVAYVVGGSALIEESLVDWFNFLPSNIGSSITLIFILALSLLFGTRTTDLFNRWLMAGLVISSILLVGFGLPHISRTNLSFIDWGQALYIFPPLIVSFGFHNLVPGLTDYLKKDVSSIRKAIVWGTTLPLILYFFWETVILGIVPMEGPDGFRASLDKGSLATEALHSAVGSNLIGNIGSLFAFFALITSFLAVALSFINFLGDGLKISTEKKTNRFFLCGLVLLPPLLFAVSDPSIFLKALNHAGGIGATILFGLLPSLMAWSGRYFKKYETPYRLFGGKPILVVLMLISLSILFFHFKQEFFNS